jgi:ribosomal protein L30/L7E
MIAAIRIAGQCKINKKHAETLDRLKLQKKLTCRLIDKDDVVRLGMIKSAEDTLVYGEISDELAEELKAKRGKDGKDVLFLHPPRGGFKKTTKTRYPQGILGHNPNIAKLLERMM